VSESISDVPDLRSLLAEASPASASVTVPLKQGLREAFMAAEAELEAAAVDGKPRRMSASSPLKVAAEKVEAIRAEMAASALTFHFGPLTYEERDQIRQDMRGRDNDDETNLRAIAAMCRRVVAADGREFSERMTWEDFRLVRDRLGAKVFDDTIDDAANRVSGGQWSVPFSPAASHILGTET
jgi:hypothetical protein